MKPRYMFLVYKASHSFSPFRKHGCIAVISSVALHFRLAIFNSKKIQSLILALNNSYCENIAVRFHKMHHSKIPDNEALFNISP